MQSVAAFGASKLPARMRYFSLKVPAQSTLRV
jgi:hypothetical protein